MKVLKVRRSSLLIIWVLIFSIRALAQTDWHDTIPASMQQLLSTTPPVSPIQVAHRGVFADKAPYLPENSLAAYERAYDEGDRDVEVDIRTTADGYPIMMHDDGPSRTTDIDSTSAHDYTPLYNAQVKSEGGDTLRQLNTDPSPKNMSLSLSEFQSKFHHFKIYDNVGALYGTSGGLTSNPYVLKSLFDFLNGTADPYSVKLRDVTWVLDIQTYQALKSAMEIVSDYNMWNRVVFKLWANAFPYTLNAESPARPVPALPFNKGFFVLSFSAKNITEVNSSGTVTTASISFWNNSTSEAGTLQYDATSTGVVSDVGYLLNQLATTDGSARLIGIEQFIDARTSGNPIDEYLESNASPIYSYRTPAGQQLLSYGVVRGADLVMQNCNQEASSRLNCAVFPNGNYNANTDVLNQVTTATGNARATYGKMFNAWIVDVVQTTPSAPGDLVLTPGAGIIKASWTPPTFLPTPGQLHYLITYTSGSTIDGVTKNFLSGQITTTESTVTIYNLPPTAINVTVQAIDSSGKAGDMAAGNTTPSSGPYIFPQYVPVGDYVIGSPYKREVATNGNSNGMFQDVFSAGNTNQKWHISGTIWPKITAEFLGTDAYVYAKPSIFGSYYLYATGSTSQAHKFYLTPKLDGTYTIADISMNGLLWDSDSAYYAGYLYLGNSTDGREKRFFVHPYNPNAMPTGIYTITSVVSAAAIENNNPVNGDYVVMSTPGQVSSQQWYITPIPGSTPGQYSMVNMATGKVLDNRGYNQSDEPVGDWDYLANDNQKWNFSYFSDGTIQIKNPASGLCLYSPSTTGSTQLVQATCNGSTALHWILQLQQIVPPVIR